MARYEHYLAANMNIQSHYKVLDIGCGVGGPAFEICHFTGAHVTGLNINDYQISRAKRYAVVAGLDARTTFIKGDFMNMPITDNSYDACYAIEATVHASTLEGVYGEAYRVLKPRGVFGCYEWVMTDKYDPTNREHLRIVRGIEVGNDVAKLVTEKDRLRALKNMGFTIEKALDSAANDDKVKWYYPLQGDICKANSVWDYTTLICTSYMGRTLATTYSRPWKGYISFLQAVLRFKKFLKHLPTHLWRVLSLAFSLPCTFLLPKNLAVWCSNNSQG